MINFHKYFTPIASTFSFLALSQLICIDTARALNFISNGGFESNYSSWTTTGDASIQQTFQGIAAPTGTNHALITTASQTRIDDFPTPAARFNKSGTDQVSASIETATLQTFLGLSPNALSILRENGQITGYRTPKEGSAIKQTFTVNQSGQLTVNFKWNYLTNDGANSILGDRDFAFFTLYNVNDPIENRTIIRLDDSTGTVPTLNSNSTDFAKVGGYKTYTQNFGNLAAGNYVLGYGVADVDGSDRSSALLVDNLTVEEIPFEFSPALGLGIVAVMFGCARLRRIRSKTVDNFSERSPLNH